MLLFLQMLGVIKYDHSHKTNQVVLFIIVAYYITTLHRR